MDDKYTSKLSPTVDFWAGMYLLVIGEYIVDFHHCHIVLTAVWETHLSLYRFIGKDSHPSLTAGMKIKLLNNYLQLSFLIRKNKSIFIHLKAHSGGPRYWFFFYLVKCVMHTYCPAHTGLQDTKYIWQQLNKKWLKHTFSLLQASSQEKSADTKDIFTTDCIP